MELSQLCRTGYYSFHESQNVYKEVNCEAGKFIFVSDTHAFYIHSIVQ